MGRFHHELVWAPIFIVLFAVARWVPQSALPALSCPFRTVTSVPCLTCGATRATRALVHLDFGAAFVMNPLVAVLLVGAAAYVVYAASRLLPGQQPWRPALSSKAGQVARVGILLAVAANWTYLIAVGR